MAKKIAPTEELSKLEVWLPCSLASEIAASVKPYLFSSRSELARVALRHYLDFLGRRNNSDGSPLVGEVSAGKPMNPGEPMEPKRVVCSEYPQGDDYFYRRVSGDSMNNRIPDGALALIHKRLPRPGDVVCAMLEFDGYREAALKVFWPRETGIELWPDSCNPAHSPYFIANDGEEHREGFSPLSPQNVFVEGVWTGGYIVTG